MSVTQHVCLEMCCFLFAKTGPNGVAWVVELRGICRSQAVSVNILSVSGFWKNFANHSDEWNMHAVFCELGYSHLYLHLVQRPEPR